MEVSRSMRHVNVQLFLIGTLSLFVAAPAWAQAKKPSFEPTSAYRARTIQGWTIRVHHQLLTHKKLAQRTFKLLDVQLYQITRVVPQRALELLRQVPIWVEQKGPVTCMCYHPSRRWLQDNGFNPEKARGVELGNAANFLGWTKQQPWMVLHELAHAYHHRVLGYGNRPLLDAFAQARQTKQYERVLHVDGRSVRHYALTNVQEYFAEATEAYFGTNDMYPFVNPELKAHDATLHALLGKLWNRPGPRHDK